MSANLVVDLGNTCISLPSILPSPFLSGGLVAGASGPIIGNIVDLIHGDTYCNLNLVGISASGQLRVQIQTSPTTNSGDFTDPTSGFTQFPGCFESGTILRLNSGGGGGGLLGGSSGVSGGFMASGFNVSQAFLRPHRYARANVLLETNAQFAGSLTASFITQKKVTGSGGGFTFSPGGGGDTVNV